MSSGLLNLNHVVIIGHNVNVIMQGICEYINQLIEADELWKFYKSKDWIRLKRQVLSDQHHECQVCKAKGIVTRYDENGKLLQTVHHVNHVRVHPELALSRYYVDEQGHKQENLLTVCKVCHNRLHDRFEGSKPSGFMNTERW